MKKCCCLTISLVSEIVVGCHTREQLMFGTMWSAHFMIDVGGTVGNPVTEWWWYVICILGILLMLRSFKTCYIMLLNLLSLKVLLNSSLSGQQKETQPSPWSTHISLKEGTTTCVQWMLYKVEGSQLISRIRNAIPNQDCYLFASENGLYEFDRNADLASLFPLQDIKIKWLCTVAHGCHNYRKAKRLRNLLSKPWNSGKETMTCSYPMAGRCFNAWMPHSFSTVPTLGTWTSLEILRKKKQHSGTLSIPNLP